MNAVDAVFFDLDGTLADTAIDLAASLNQLLAENDQPTLPLRRVRDVASHGSVAMLEIGFNIDKEYAGFKAYQQRFLTIYRQRLTDNPCFMKGMVRVIEFLTAANIPWGIVTNKPAWLTEPLVAAMPWPQESCRPSCVVSGDTVSRSKPYPDSLLHACRLIDVHPEKCVYVGDAKRDIQAGMAAGMKTVAALFGYISKQDKPENWEADYSVISIEDLPNILPRIFVN